MTLGPSAPLAGRTETPLVPTPGQLAWQEAGFGIFLHFGINTFNGVEWGDGTLDPATFRPARLDARQWVRTAAEAGAKYVVLTAKHHDGFCLWPTDTTAYSVASSPWKDGAGDVVAELAEACGEAGLGLGLYLAPWDRNADCYGQPADYDSFYLRQLTELCTRYGPLCELWFDGAGSEGRTYDWDAVMAVIDRHQPDAMVFNMGRPTIRWVGNEEGLAADPCRYVTHSTGISLYDDGRAELDSAAYLPPECDVPIRGDWFWQPGNHDSLKSREELLEIWYSSVGLGAGLLLGVPPDRRGLVDDADRDRLLAFAAELERRLGDPVSATLTAEGNDLLADFGRPVRVDHVELREDLTRGQRVDAHEVWADGRLIASGHTVGVRRVHRVEPLTVRELRIRLTGTGARLASARAAGPETGPETGPPPGVS
ncbi:alpha-L-fucosidase [Streptomyces sp. NPDC099050]|uniref:alpha-L-fucosidase n=1 Tax=Streptomyces sp. NPDC099050 TaxID=3366100 RepID=UPI0038262472